MVSDFLLAFLSARLTGLNPCSNGIWSLTYSSTGANLRALGLNPCSNGIWSLTAPLFGQTQPAPVLILVLMEYGLWLFIPYSSNERACVLILVLMEYGLWRPLVGGIWTAPCVRLNPCSNGIWSLTARNRGRGWVWISLNPCSNGIWSLTSLRSILYPIPAVLILVLMEYGLWRAERTQRLTRGTRLNPCSNGIWSLTECVCLVALFQLS